MPEVIEPRRPATVAGIVRFCGMPPMSRVGAKAAGCGATTSRAGDNGAWACRGCDWCGTAEKTRGGRWMRGGGGKLPTARASERGIVFGGLGGTDGR